MKEFKLGEWVTVTHYYRRVERQGVQCWEIRQYPTPRRGVWIGTRDVVSSAKALWDGFGLRPLGGNMLAVQIIAMDDRHAPIWAPIEALERT